MDLKILGKMNYVSVSAVYTLMQVLQCGWY